MAHGVVVDRSVFYNVMDKNVMQFPDGNKRALNKTEFDRYAKRQIVDGLYDVHGIQYHELLMPPDGAEVVVPLHEQLLPGVRQFEVTAFATSVPEPTSADDELDFAAGTHPYANKAHPLRSVFGNMMAAKR